MILFIKYYIELRAFCEIQNSGYTKDTNPLYRLLQNLDGVIPVPTKSGESRNLRISQRFLDTRFRGYDIFSLCATACVAE
jgi:hypothetical protein